MKNIIVLNIHYKFGNMEGLIHPVILNNKYGLILIDCGYTGFMPILEKAIGNEGLDINRLSKIIITHHDHDHMGALADIKQKYPHIKVVASEIEAPFICGEKKSLRLEQAEELQYKLSEEQKPFGKAFCEILKNVKPATVDIIVKGGDVFDWCEGCEIISTPGHTPGHISLYLKNFRTIITGDAFALKNNKIIITNPEFTLDFKKAEESISKLLSYDADTYICYHGGIYKR